MSDLTNPSCPTAVRASTTLAAGQPGNTSSLVPSRSPASPGATATTTSEAAASADSPPGRRSNLQGRVLAGSAILTLYSACLLAATALGRVVG